VLGGEVGLAISQSLILTGSVQYGMKQTTESISLMTAVERILQYTNLPREGTTASGDPPPPTWPSQGHLTFKDVSMRYNKDDAPVLKVSQSIVQMIIGISLLNRHPIITCFAGSQHLDRARLEGWRGGSHRCRQVLPHLSALPLVQRGFGRRDQNRWPRHQHGEPAKPALQDLHHTAGTGALLRESAIQPGSVRSVRRPAAVGGASPG